MQLKYGPWISIREENNGEEFSLKICCFLSKRPTVPLFALLVSSAVTKEVLFPQVPILANQMNQNHFQASDCQRSFLAIGEYETKTIKGESDTDPANTSNSEWKENPQLHPSSAEAGLNIRETVSNSEQFSSAKNSLIIGRSKAYIYSEEQETKYSKSKTDSLKRTF